MGSQSHHIPGSGTSHQGQGHLCKSLSSLYAMVMVTWYLALASTKIISYENYFNHLNEDIFEVKWFLQLILPAEYIAVEEMGENETHFVDLIFEDPKYSRNRI